MKESIHTIPLTDAFKAEDECPFCYLEREAEQHAISFALGSGASYICLLYTSPSPRDS